MTPRKKQPPAINAPWPVAAFALVLVGAHLVRVLLPTGLQNVAFFYGAVIPERFWGGGADLPPYANMLEAFLPAVLSAFVHSDWMHVVINAAFFVALGKPLLDLFRAAWPQPGLMAFLVLLSVFFVSQVAGVMTYLVLNNPAGYPSIGASGGISGMIAGVLLFREGPDRWLFSRGFLVASALFVVGNALFAFIGPALLGTSISWETHIGGYAGGALFMRALIWIMERRAG
jgi:membrane associated rhomboid family serine protease